MVYKFRVILDTEEDVIRDISILRTDTLEDLHKAIYTSFGFSGTEVASFYNCDDDWGQEGEIPLFDIGEFVGESKTMSDYKLMDILDKENKKILYVYDFINMWTFFVELVSVDKIVEGKKYPETLLSIGQTPEESPNKNFEAEPEDFYSEFEDDLDQDDLDMFSEDDFLDNSSDNEENWN